MVHSDLGGPLFISFLQLTDGKYSWSAVARGAIIKSLGVYTEKPLLVRSCPRHYGIKVRTQYAAYKHSDVAPETDIEGIPWATDQIRWFIQKGDGIFPNKPLLATYDCHWSMKASEFPSTNKKGPHTRGEVFRDVVFIASAQDEGPIRFDKIDKGKSRCLCTFTFQQEYVVC